VDSPDSESRPRREIEQEEYNRELHHENKQMERKARKKLEDACRSEQSQVVKRNEQFREMRSKLGCTWREGGRKRTDESWEAAGR